MPTGLDADEHHKQLLADIMVWPFGLGYQYLGPHYYACSGNTSVCDGFT